MERRGKMARSAMFFLFISCLLISLRAEEAKKIKVAVLPPSASGDASASVSQGLTSVIVTELSRSPSLEVSDRRDVDKALKEQAFGQAGYCEQSCQIEIGKILQSKWVVTGDLNKIGTLYILTLKILNVETSKIEYQDEEEYKGEVEGLVPKTKTLTSRLASFLATGKKPKVVKEQPKEEKKKTIEHKKTKEETKEVTIVPKEEKKVNIKNTIDTFGMIYIPAGEFWMGNDTGDNDERPGHKVYLDAYKIDKYEVTNAQFKDCVNEGVCFKPSGTTYYDLQELANHPVVDVDWNQALDYCKWAEKRLPTEAEWEKASRGERGNMYPWGNIWNEKKCNNRNYNGPYTLDMSKMYEGRGTTPVGKFPECVSPYGVYDMAGNVWEWVSDWYDFDYYKNSPQKNPKGPTQPKDKFNMKVVRGGSWSYDIGTLRAVDRGKFYDGFSYEDIGFRCAEDAK